MAVYTTEIASDSIPSDNPVHQRLLKAYYVAQDYVQGHVLEIGCGEGRGLDMLAPKSTHYVAVDKIAQVIERLQAQYPTVAFHQMHIPPLQGLPDNTFDVVVSFQVIEHIKNDLGYLQEIYRVLKPGGLALITTPNIVKSLSRNPWHVREYTAQQLTSLAQQVFDKVEMKGITGNEKVWQYYEMNKKSVQRIMRFDVLNLQYRLPAWMLRAPYEFLNRRNRNKLEVSNDSLVAQINHTDYFVSQDAAQSLDLLGLFSKKA